MNKFSLVALFSMAVLACGGDDDGGNGVVMGDSADAYGGSVTSYVTLENDVVVDVGFVIDDAAVTGADEVPAGTFDGYPIGFPEEALAQTAFQHSLINFYGDGLVGTPWEQPFWAMHFAFISQSALQSVGCPQPTAPAVDAVPEAYLVLGPDEYPAGGCVSGEGLHAVDGLAGEVQDPPEDFETSMWLTYDDGTHIAAEPFVTNAVLLAQENFTMTLRQPAEYSEHVSGTLYPTSFRGEYADGEWKIFFTGFEAIE